MALQEKILTYLSVYGKEDKYKLARNLKADVAEVTKVLDQLEQEGRIEIKEGKAALVKNKKSTEEGKEDRPKEEFEEKPAEEEIEENVEEDKAEESTEEKVTKEEAELEEEKIEGTVKFYNPNKRFGYITGDDGKDYRVHESGLKEGATIEANDRVSFKVIMNYKGPEAVEVEKISESAGVQYA